ncbi:ABC transporter substrate-binding protein [Nocardioides perillae]|uniref:ABC-type branched-subunit amino acid transport system substrate-binding protein n=1 Tax=Nocardioides perillae TaxID=1119534 RepID=A0A7Y9RXK5_9ACTN|nr:ABC-type branched-subunit amino acid transport system substrate-binding protein [Nocardioides perillae]
MELRNKRRAGAVGLAVLALVATGCRGGDSGGEAGGVDAPGVTSEPCPEAVNEDNGCIYLGTISDLTQGPFAPLGVPITEAQEAFWARVNEEGGIGGYDIDVTEYVRDNLYNPETHAQVYNEIEPDVLALAQTLGSPTTLAILSQMENNDVVGAPASWTSLWGFEDNILESGASYCVEGMNVVDYFVENEGIASVMAVGYPGDFGGDAAAGAEIAAGERNIDFTNVETAPGQEAQAGAISQIVRENPDLVLLSVGPTETAVIVGQAAAQGYTGQFVGTAPTWNPALLQSPAAPALEQLFVHSGPWGSFSSDTDGHAAMREAIGEVDQPNDGYTSGWAWSYPLKAALEEWLEGDYDKTRAGLVEAIGNLETVDFEGMLPEEAGDRTGENDIFKQTVLSDVDPEAAAGLTIREDFFTGPTAEAYEFEGACFEG